MNSPAGTSVRVTTYLRVSSFGQTQKEFGSLDKQLENAKMMVAHYAEKNWILVSEFRDPGITGTDDNRPGLAALMAAAERHEFDVVIFQFLDRLSRHASYTLRLLERLQELGIEVYDSDGLRIDITTPEGLIRAGIGALFAQAAHQKMVKATRKGVTTKASKGYSSGGMAGYGYDRIEDTKIGIAPNPVQAPIMQEAYRRLAGGEDLSEVVSDFRARGIRTKTRVFNGKGGERTVGNMLFTTDQLERMIRNSLYRGKVRCRYDDDAASNISIQKPLEMDRYEKGYAIYQGQFKALVSDELWWQANHALDKRTKRKLPSRPVDPAGRFLLQGRFKCGCCKCQMATTHTRGRSGAKFYYYKCRHHIEDGDQAKCSVRALPITLVHGTVMRFLTRVIMQPEIIAATLEGVKSQTRDDKGRHHRELKEVNVQLAGIRGEISHCVDAVTKQLVPALLPDLRKRASELKEREQALLQKHWELAARCNAEFAGYPNEADVMATLNDFVTKVEYLSSPQQKELVGLLIKDVTVFNAMDRSAKNGPGKSPRWRFLVRLRLDGSSSGTRTAALPLQFTVEVPSSSGWQYRFIEPFEGIEVESCAPKKAESPELAENEDDTEVDSHPLMVARKWMEQSRADPSLTQASFARQVGKCPGLISKYRRLLDLDEHIQTVLTQKPSAKTLGRFSYRDLRSLLKLPRTQQLATFRRELGKAKSS